MKSAGQNMAKASKALLMATLIMPAACIQSVTESDIARADKSGKWDGSWLLTANSDDLRCGSQKPFTTIIKNGQVHDSKRLAGVIETSGNLRVQLRNPSGQDIIWTGEADGDAITGTWVLTGTPCTGTWTAKRK